MLASKLESDILNAPNGKAVENDPAVSDFATHMQEARDINQKEQEEAKKEATKVPDPQGSDNVKNGDEVYLNDEKGEYKEVEGDHYFVPEGAKDLTDEQITSETGEEAGVVEVETPGDLETKETLEDIEANAEKDVKIAAEEIKEEEKQEQKEEGKKEDGSDVPTLNTVEEDQEVVNEEAEGLDSTEDWSEEDDLGNSEIEITTSSGEKMPALNVVKAGESFMQFLLSKIEDIFINESVNVPVRLNKKAFKKFKSEFRRISCSF